jgi:hypothetical protein
MQRRLPIMLTNIIAHRLAVIALASSSLSCARSGDDDDFAARG